MERSAEDIKKIADLTAENRRLLIENAQLRAEIKRLTSDSQPLRKSAGSANGESGNTERPNLFAARLSSRKGLVDEGKKSEERKSDIAPDVELKVNPLEETAEDDNVDDKPGNVSNVGSGSKTMPDDFSPRKQTLFSRAANLIQSKGKTMVSPRSASSEAIRLPSSSGENISSPTILDREGSTFSGPQLSVNVMSLKKVGKNSFFMLGVRQPEQRNWTIVPRRYQDFRELHANLIRQFGDVVVPELPAKKMTQSDKDLQVSLQGYLDNLITFEATAKCATLAAFLDPAEQPSFYCLTEVVKATRQGRLMMYSNRVWKPVLCVLHNSLYVYRSEDDVQPAEVLSLQFVTLDIVASRMEGAPPYLFRISDLAESTETLFGLDSTKEVSEWILALREAKVNKMGLGYWVKAPAQNEDDASNSVLPETLQQRKVEMDAACAVFRTWLDGDRKSFVTKQPIKVLCKRIDAAPVDVDFEGADSSALFTRVRDDDSVQVMGATRARLLGLLMDPAGEVQFVEEFISTYRLFLTTSELYLTLMAHYLSTEDWDSRTRVAFVLAKWVEMHYFDFARDARLAKMLLEFVTTWLDEEDENAICIQGIIEASLVTDERQNKAWLKRAPKPILPDMYHRNMFDFIDLSPIEVARQLTILEFQLFGAIEGRELLHQCWNGANKDKDAPNVTVTIRRFNQMSGWITSLLCKVKSLKARAALLRRFIDIAENCLQLNNFNSVVEIVSGLQTTAVRRLTDTFDLLPEETKTTFQQLKDLLETRKNWEKYRGRLTSATPPCVPYLGLYLTDLTMIDEACKSKVVHPDYPDVKLLNMDRAARIAAVQAEIRTFQSVKYCLKPISYIQEYLNRLDQMTEEECYQLSLELQPRKQ